MGFNDILVHIDSSPQYLNRLDLAIRLARDHGAKLTGLYVVTHQYYRPEQEGLRRRISEAEEVFRQKTAREQVPGHWLCADWAVVGGSMVEVINYYAHAKDLVIVGQTSHGQPERDYPLDLPERVVKGAGRPVLVVPYAGSFESVGNRVIVAWKPGRSSARAVNDAMPFLTAAKDVRLLEIRSPDDQKTVEVSPREDIAGHLRLHGIAVKEEHLVTGDIPVANILMNYAWENGCDLVVMGAYSYSGRGTIQLGSIADQMLDSMTVPVLLAH